MEFNLGFFLDETERAQEVKETEGTRHPWPSLLLHVTHHSAGRKMQNGLHYTAKYQRAVPGNESSQQKIYIHLSIKMN